MVIGHVLLTCPMWPIHLSRYYSNAPSTGHKSLESRELQDAPQASLLHLS